MMIRAFTLALPFIAFAFLASLIGRFTMGEDWSNVSRIGMPVLLVVSFFFVFLRLLRPSRREATQKDHPTDS